MDDFALVTEGPTDHAILKNILLGYFKNQREPARPGRPPKFLASLWAFAALRSNIVTA